jgi:hypothetical protein
MGRRVASGTVFMPTLGVQNASISRRTKQRITKAGSGHQWLFDGSFIGRLDFNLNE